MQSFLRLAHGLAEKRVESNEPLLSGSLKGCRLLRYCQIKFRTRANEFLSFPFCRSLSMSISCSYIEAEASLSFWYIKQFNNDNQVNIDHKL